ncbi:trehalose-6-phosphate synthase [Rhodococcus sp. 3Y1]
MACRGDLGGALVLSEFTGAAMELRQSYLVNPHDLDGVKNTILTAVHQDPKEGRRRMAALHRQVMTHDVHQWAESFLTALAPPGPLPDDQFVTGVSRTCAQQLTLTGLRQCARRLELGLVSVHRQAAAAN